MKRFLICFSLTLMVLLRVEPGQPSAHSPKPDSGLSPERCEQQPVSNLNAGSALVSFMIKPVSPGGERRNSKVEEAEIEREEDEVDASKKHLEIAVAHPSSLFTTPDFLPLIKKGTLLVTQRKSDPTDRSYIMFGVFRI